MDQRTLPMEWMPFFSTEQAGRHELGQGITGRAQVNDRNAISWENKLHLDLWHVDHRGPWMYIEILWLTAKKVLVPDGISEAGVATMPQFTVSKTQEKQP